MTIADLPGATGRYVSKDWRRHAQPNGCAWCGSGVDGTHRPTTCLACGVTQCHAHHSECRACFYGWLPGWSRGYVWADDGSTRNVAGRCGYKGCENPAVAKAPRVGRVCADHLDRPKLHGATLAEEILANRTAALTSGDYRDRWRRMVWRPAAGCEDAPPPELPAVGQGPGST